MRGRRKTMLAVVAAAVVALVSGGAAFLLLRDANDEPTWTSAPGMAVPAKSCAELPEPDFGFTDLPPIREPRFDVPSPRRWPVVSLDTHDGLLVRPDEYYGLTLADATQRQVTRDWRVKARMLALNEHGEVVGEVSHDKLTPDSKGRHAFPNLSMRVGEQPGFYKLDIRIAAAGRWSGRYGLYLQAVQPHGEARLVLAGRRFEAGQRVGMRVENLGSEPVTYGTPVSLERHVDDDWRPVPGEYVFTLIGLGAAGGEAGSCLSFELPSKLRPGRYRFLKEVKTRKEPRGYHDHNLTAEFEVVD